MVSDGAITESKIDKTGILEWTDDEGNKVFQVGQMYFGNDKFEVSYTDTINRVSELEGMVGSIELMGEQIFKEIQGVVSPSSITLNAVCRNGVSVGHWYIDDVENTSYVSLDKLSITIPSTELNDKSSITVKIVDSTGELYDVQTLYLISDTEGSEGQAAISVIITSSNGTVFNEDTTLTNTLFTCTVYEGVNEITPKSYEWKIMNDDDASWTSIGTSKQVTLNIDKSIIRRRIKCDVDIDI